MARPASEVIDLVSSSDEETDATSRSYKNIKLHPHGKRGRDAPNATHLGRTAKKGAKKKVHPTDYQFKKQGFNCSAVSVSESTAENSERQARRQRDSSTCDRLAPLTFIDSDGTDDAIVTEGLLSAIAGLQLPKLVTCAGIAQSRNTEQGYNHGFSVLHIKQNDKWSCGFRNLQMILSSLIPQLSSGHRYFQVVPDSLTRYPSTGASVPTPLPSLTQLQIFLEQAWKDGFDPRGAQHYRGSIVGKTSEIGAVEVSSCLSFLNIDSTVVQFIRCKESRSLLGPFVCVYFKKFTGSRGCCFCSNVAKNGSLPRPPSTVATALDILRLAGSRELGGNGAISCHCPVLPLYLQWKGHSVTVVGVEENIAPNRSKQTPTNINLLLFDPMMSGQKLKQSLSDFTKGNKDSLAAKKTLSSIRLPASKLLDKDCQILMCSLRPLSEIEKQSYRDSICAVTAAKSEVERSAINF